MTRQTLLVYLSEAERAQSLLTVASALARRHLSHLIGVYAIPPISVYPIMGMEFPQAVYDGHMQTYLERAKEMETVFDNATRGQSFAAEWRTVDSGAGSIAGAMMDHVRCADFAIGPHYDSDSGDTPYAGTVETLATLSGRPILTVPEKFDNHTVGERITIAWNGSRESVRAVFDSIALLQDAKEVRIISIGDAAEDDGKTMLPAAEIAETLARREIACEVDHICADGLTAGEAILGRVKDTDSDLLVMGLYGHSRLREFIFGGVTRHVVKNATVPVLFSH